MLIDKDGAQLRLDTKPRTTNHAIHIRITKSQWQEAIKHVEDREKTIRLGQWRPEIIFCDTGGEVHIHIEQD